MADVAGFSLVDHPWIEATTPAGDPVTVSLREVFDGTVALADVRGDSPTQDYAVLRVLLAIYWRAHQPDSEVAPGETFDIEDWLAEELDNAADGNPDEYVLAYLEQHRDRFDLLHPETPFMQVADLTSGKDNAPTIERIVPEAEDEYFTMRAGESRNHISLGEAARWIIHVHAFDYSGIKTGMVGDERVKGGRGYPIGTGWTGMTGGTVILGPTLRETLVLNTTVEALASPNDRPVWERTPDTAAARDTKSPPEPSQPMGPADFATWQTRRVRLFADGDRVNRVFVGNGDRIEEAGANAFGDPMTPYRYSTNKSTKDKDIYYPAPYSAERTMWRSLEPLLVLEGDLEMERKKKPPLRPLNISTIARLRAGGGLDTSTINIRLVSMAYGPQASSVGTTLTRELDMPVDLLREGSRRQRRVVLNAANVTSTACAALGSFAGQLHQAAGGDYAYSTATTDQLLGSLERPFQEWLKGLELETIDASAAQWQRMVARSVLAHADILLRGAGPRALIGREESSSEDQTRTVSAGTAYIWLKRKLRDTLPLAFPAPDDTTPSQDREDS